MPPLLFGRQGGNHNDCFQQSLYHVPGEFTNYYARFLTFFRNRGKESFNNKKSRERIRIPGLDGLYLEKTARQITTGCFDSGRLSERRPSPNKTPYGPHRDTPPYL